MKSISWNCRGMLSSTAVQELLELHGRTCADLIFISESHLNKNKADERSEERRVGKECSR